MNKLLVFDVDDTILDTSEIFYQLWKIILEEFGKGDLLSNKQHFLDIQKKYNGNWREFAVNEFKIYPNYHKKVQQIGDSNIKELYDKYGKEFEGLNYVFNSLKSNGYKIAIATNNYTEVIRNSITKILGNEITIFSKTTHKQFVKPYPHMLHDLSRIYNYKIGDIIMIGNEKGDYKFAINAGTNFIGVSFNGREPIKYFPEIINSVDSFKFMLKCLLEGDKLDNKK